MIPNKYIFMAAGALAIWFLYSQFIGLVEDNAQKDQAIESLAETINIQAAARKQLDTLNTQMVTDNEELAMELSTERERIKKLPLTKQQEICKRVDLPIGYIDGLHI